jgi:anti-sigma factor RsiW
MKDYNDMKERNWRRGLTAAESAEMRRLLESHPEAAEDWACEEALSRALQQLPAVAVSSNFTARVLAGVRRSRPEREAAAWFFRGWWPRLAAGALMVGLGFFSFQEYVTAQRTREAREIAAASRLAALPPTDWLNDFDTIQGLDKVKVADDELLSVLE